MSSPVVATGRATCNHSGGLVLTASQPLLVVDGSPVLLADDLASAAVSTPPCTTVPDTSKGLVTCTTVTSRTAGAATLLNVAGAAVALDSAAGLTNGSTGSPGTGTWSVQSAGQTLLAAT